MNLQNKLKIVIIIILLLILGAVILLSNNYVIANKTCKMRFDNNQGVQGVWYTDDGNEYMCVWLDEYVNDTLDHETCHSLVYNNYNHFCYKG